MDLNIDDESLGLIMEIIKDLHVFGMPWIVTLLIIDDYNDFVYTARRRLASCRFACL